MSNISRCALLWMAILGGGIGRGANPSEPDIQRRIAHTRRLVEAFDSIGYPVEPMTRRSVQAARTKTDVEGVEKLLDSMVVATVTINPESRVKVAAGKSQPILQQSGYVPWLIKIENQGDVKSPIQVNSPQAGPGYSGVALLSMQRQAQLELRHNEIKPDSPSRFLHFEWFANPPMAPVPSGVESEYAILLVYSSEKGRHDCTLEFSVGSGTQDLGFRAQLPLVIDTQAAIPVTLKIKDEDGTPAFARLTIRDSQGHVYPPQPRRLAPDLFFQQQIYRENDELVELPPGTFEVEYSQGPETQVQVQHCEVHAGRENVWQFQLKRWVHPSRDGWYSGDHHIHGAGCAHYTSPTEGVTPQDMFRQVAGEGLNVGCVLTWGPCFEFQRHFFRPSIDDVSRPKTLLKYDIEISGFGSQALGHVCLLNLRDQYFPGSEGTKEKGWPTWTTPALRWAKAQGAVTGFAHSASGLQVDAHKAADRLFRELDRDGSGLISNKESEQGFLPASFVSIDNDRDKGISQVELESAIDKAADHLPNLAVPEMNSVGAMELPVAITQGVCDFISTMDTARIAEWNMWYHILNCGYPLKASGETDFPCMSGNAVGQGRVYVQLGQLEKLDFTRWCDGLAAGRSYVSDGYAHALKFRISCGDQSVELGQSLKIKTPSTIRITSRIAVAAQMRKSVAYATREPEGGKRFLGDTVTLHGPRFDDWVPTGTRTIELVVNGQAIQSQTVECNGETLDVDFSANIEKSSWVAVRVFPHLHTNPIEVIIDEHPIRASSDSAKWCVEVIKQLWRQREKNIAVNERPEAKTAFDDAIAEYQKRAKEAVASSK